MSLRFELLYSRCRTIQIIPTIGYCKFIVRFNVLFIVFHIVTARDL